MLSDALNSAAVLFSLLCFTCGSVYDLDLELLGGDGFTINPYGKELDSESDIKQFYFYNINGGSWVRGRFGELEAVVNITSSKTGSRYKDPLLQTVLKADSAANVTAHIFKQTITNSKPTVRVLIHSDGPLASAKCAQVTAFRTDSEVISSSCLLWDNDLGSLDGTAVCLADIMLPYDWWSSRLIDIYFDLKPSVVCTSISNKITKTMVPSREDLAFVGDVVLMFDDSYSTKEIAEDNNVVLSLPDQPIEAGNLFSVSLKLQPGSEYTDMSVKLIIDDDILFKSVQNWDSSMWTVLWKNEGKHAVIIDIKPNTSGHVYKSQDVISCHFEVSSGITNLDAALQWQISYGSSGSEEAEVPVTLVIDTQIEVSPASQISAITAVTKTSEVVSLKRFNGVINTLPIWIYSVNELGQVHKINRISTCQSDQPNIISISTLCDIVYIVGDGGDPGISSITIESGGQEVSLPLRVWYPDVGMILKLSDSKLNKIKGWFIPDSDESSCRQQYQPANIQVFTRFYTVYDRKDIYLRGQGKTLIFSDVTETVRYQLSTSNEQMIRYNTTTGLLNAYEKGKAYLKVLNNQGRALASTIIRVSSHQVSVDRVEAKMITDLSLSVEHDAELDIYTARYSYENVLSDKHPVGYVELLVRFSDEKVIPLSAFDTDSHELELTNETPDVLEIVSSLRNQSRYFTVRGKSTGTSRLKITIRSKCSGSMPVIYSGYVYLESSISLEDEAYLNDEAYISSNSFHMPKAVFRPDKDSMRGSPSHKSFKPVRVQAVQGGSKQNPGLSSTETGLFVLIGVLGVVATILASNFLAYVYKKRKSEQPDLTDSATSEKTSNGWVWLDRSTLENNEICTTPEPFLDERSFLSNVDRRTKYANSTGNSFKRNSTGTYKGSECSIRITNNPFTDSLDQNQSVGNLESVQPVLDLTGGSDGEESETELDLNCHNITQEEFDCMKETVA